MAGERHQISLEDLGRLSLDDDQNLYWDGKKIKTEAKLSLTWPQKLITGAFALVTGLSAFTSLLVDIRDLGGWPDSAAASDRAAVREQQERGDDEAAEIAPLDAAANAKRRDGQAHEIDAVL